MRRLALAATLLFLASSAGAAGRLEVVQPWSRPAAAGTTGVGYMTLANHGAADALTAVESPAARRVEIHHSDMAGGIMRMHRLDRAPIPAGGHIAFAPGGDHLMFIGLTRALKPGDRLPAVLIFASGARLSVAFAVGTGMAAPTMDPAMRH